MLLALGAAFPPPIARSRSRLSSSNSSCSLRAATFFQKLLVSLLFRVVPRAAGRGAHLADFLVSRPRRPCDLLEAHDGRLAVRALLRDGRGVISRLAEVLLPRVLELSVRDDRAGFLTQHRVDEITLRLLELLLVGREQEVARGAERPAN